MQICTVERERVRESGDVSIKSNDFVKKIPQGFSSSIYLRDKNRIRTASHTHTSHRKD